MGSGRAPGCRRNRARAAGRARRRRRSKDEESMQPLTPEERPKAIALAVATGASVIYLLWSLAPAVGPARAQAPENATRDAVNVAAAGARLAVPAAETD